MVAVAGGERQTPIAEFVRSVSNQVSKINGEASGILPKDKWPKKSYHDVTGNYVYKLMRLNENGQIEAPMAEGQPVEFGAWLS